MEWRSSVRQLIDSSGADAVAVAFYDLETNERLLINPNGSFHAASTMKVFVLAELYHQAEQGKLDLEEGLLVKNEFKSIVDGSPYSIDQADDSYGPLHDQLGSVKSLLELAKPMITDSSNLATNLLVDRLGPLQITGFVKSLGADGISVLRGVEDGKAYRLGLNNTVMARGMKAVLLNLARRELVSKVASDQMISIMLQQVHRNCIPAQLPPDVKVANKPGWNAGICHDVGIVFPPLRAPYVLVVLTRGLNEYKEAPELIASISRVIYDRSD